MISWTYDSWITKYEKQTQIRINKYRMFIGYVQKKNATVEIL